jgi:hypothetical protein
VGRKIRTSIIPPFGFVNGLPLAVVELKKPSVLARAALERLNAIRMGGQALSPQAITTAKLVHLLIRGYYDQPNESKIQ